MSTLVIIPTFNEEKTIGKLIDELFLLNLKLDILIVDDGTDLLPDVVKKKQKKHKNLFLHKRPNKAGRGTAVIYGLSFALDKKYDFIVEMDADFSHQPSELPDLMNLAAQNTVVIASRYDKGSKIENWSLRRRLFSSLANLYANLILGIGISDYTNGFRVYGREAINKLDLHKIKSSGYIVLSEIAYSLYKMDVNFKTRKTLFINREHGESNFTIKEVREAFLSIWRIKFEN